MLKKFLKKIIILSIICILTIFSVLFGGVSLNVHANDSRDKIYSNTTIDDEFSDNRVIVVLTEDASKINKKYTIKDFEDIGCTNVVELNENINNQFEKFNKVLCLEFSFNSKEQVLNIINILMYRNDIYYAGPDYTIKINSASYNDSYKNLQWAIDDIELQDSWSISKGTSEVLVGILDSGINSNHPELQGKINTELSRDFIYGLEQSVDIVEDLCGHGTHVAGIIGANVNNNIGIAGSSWDIQLVSLRVFNEIGEGNFYNFALAVQYATRNNINLLNYSGGGIVDDDFEAQPFVSIINSYPGLIIVSAGNEGLNNDVIDYMPANLQCNNIISVGAYDPNLNRSIWESGGSSNYGQLSVDIYSPGSEILSTYPIHICNVYYQFSDGTLLCELDRTLVYILYHEIAISEEPIGWDYIDENFADIVYPYISGDIDKEEVVPNLFNVAEHLNTGYHYMDGTSMAAPYVTGVAALLLSLNEELTAIQLRQAILESAEEITITVPDTTEGAEEDDTVEQDVLKLNAYNAVKYVLENYMNPTTYTLSNYSSTINTNKTIASDASYFDELNGFYKLNVTYAKNYEFISSSTSGIEVTLYDEDFTEIPFNDLDSTSNKVHFIENLSTGTYYLRTKYVNEDCTGTINTQIVSRTTAYIGIGDNDVLLNTHNYNEGIYPTNYYYYNNSRGVGFYRFTLTGVKVDGTEVTYPYSSIMIKDHMNEDIIDKYSLTGYSNQAISGQNENTFVAYLNETGYFYVYIDIDTEGLKSLTLNIEPVESETIDLFTKSESTNSTMEILDSETTKGDYAKKIILKQAGEFTVNYSYSGSQSSDILFVLGKLNYNSTTQKYSVETLISQLMDAENDSFTYTLDLTDGTYFVAYFNKDDNAAFDVTFNRLVTQYGGSVLITDPNSRTDGGSQVEVYEKGLPYYEVSYRGTNIVIGFSRVIYIDYNYVDQHSREDYYWYSSNDSIATVSQHGTVFGKSAGTVKIMAVNKDDPSIVFVKQFTVVQDTKTYSEVIYSEFNDTHKLSDGEYQLGLDVQNSPYPMVQYYSWRVVSKSSTITSVIIDQWGNVEIVGTGSVVIEGYDYIYNDNYGVRINLTVTN